MSNDRSTCRYCSAAVSGDYRRHLLDAHDREELSRVDTRRVEAYRERVPGAPDGRTPLRAWVPPVLAGAVVALLVALRNLRAPYPPTSGDGALFLRSGQLVADGRLPYLHLWDVKPPGIHLTTGLLAALVDGKPALYYAANLMNVAALLGTLALVAVLAYRLTGRASSAVVGGVAPLAVTPVYANLWGGPRPKYVAVLCGLAGLYYAHRRGWARAGVAAALGAAFWQFAVVFLAAVAGLGVGLGHGALLTLAASVEPERVSARVVAWAIGGSVLALVVLGSPWLLGDPLTIQEPPRGIFWEPLRSGCHARLSAVEVAWLERVGAPADAQLCRATLVDHFITGGNQ